MSDDDHILPKLMPLLDIAAFERRPDGSFQPLSPAPAWFTRLGRDGTFPFLGHILEEAIDFWNMNVQGLQEWGPCVELDDDGREFHYKVKAINAGGYPCLVFQLDETAERLREVLQKIRSDALERRT